MDKHNNDDVKKVTNSVLSVYRRVNPSYVSGLANHEEKQNYINRWIDLITRKLMVPALYFENCSLLDVGCGSGEKSLIYAMLGAKLTGIDANEKAIEMAIQRASEWGLGTTTDFFESSVFDLELCAQFDAVISDGMIHHTANPRLAFEQIAKRVKPGGILILGLAEPCGFFQRQLQRTWVNKIAGDNEQEQIRVAKILFHDQIQRASSVSGRSEESTIYDSFINPQVIPISLHDIENWMAEYDIILDCTWPPTKIPLVSDSQYHPELTSKHEAVRGWKDITRALWVVKNAVDNEMFSTAKERYIGGFSKLTGIAEKMCLTGVLDTARLELFLDELGDVNLSLSSLLRDEIQADIKSFIEEAVQIDSQINTLSSSGMSPEEIASSIRFERLFAGFSGVGMVYYRGTRRI